MKKDGLETGPLTPSHVLLIAGMEL